MSCCSASLVMLPGGGGRGLEGDGGLSMTGENGAANLEGVSSGPAILMSSSIEIQQGNGSLLSNDGSLPKAIGACLLCNGVENGGRVCWTEVFIPSMEC